MVGRSLESDWFTQKPTREYRVQIRTRSWNELQKPFASGPVFPARPHLLKTPWPSKRWPNWGQRIQDKCQRETFH